MYALMIENSKFNYSFVYYFALLFGYLLAVALFITIVIPTHNYLQAVVAYKCGDTGIKDGGLLRRRVKPGLHSVGVASGIVLGIGFSKPVYVRKDLLYNPKYDMIKIAVTGIVAYFNFFLICKFINELISYINIFEITVRFSGNFSNSSLAYEKAVLGNPIKYIYHIFITTSYFLRFICIWSMFINLIPLKPFDAGFITEGLISERWANSIDKKQDIIASLVFLMLFVIFTSSGNPLKGITDDISKVISNIFAAIFDLFHIFDLFQ